MQRRFPPALWAAAAMTALGASSAVAAPPSATDKAFLDKDAAGAVYELESARLATSKAARDDVKTYAKMLVDDHESYNTALRQLGKDVGVDLPTQMDAADAARLSKLKDASGPAFDAAYLEEAIRINAEDKRDAERERAGTKNEAVKDFIEKFADVDAKHERLAKALNKPKS